MLKDFGGPQLHKQPHTFEQQATFKRRIMGPGGVNSSPIWSQCPVQDMCDPNYAYFFFDDFLFHTTVHGGWTSSADTSGTVAITDAKGGVVTLTAHSDDDDAAWLTSTNECWAIDSTDKIYFEARVKITEANTTDDDDANVFVGLTADTAATAVPMQAAEAGPTAVDHIAFWKLGGGTVWQYGTSDGSTQDTGSTGVTRVSGSWVRLGFIADVNQVVFYVDGLKVATVADAADIPDQEMHIVFHVKNGAAGAQILDVDWVKCVAVR